MGNAMKEVQMCLWVTRCLPIRYFRWWHGLGGGTRRWHRRQHRLVAHELLPMRMVEAHCLLLGWGAARWPAIPSLACWPRKALDHPLQLKKNSFKAEMWTLKIQNMLTLYNWWCNVGVSQLGGFSNVAELAWGLPIGEVMLSLEILCLI